jgi:hypothetical protein
MSASPLYKEAGCSASLASSEFFPLPTVALPLAGARPFNPAQVNSVGVLNTYPLCLPHQPLTNRSLSFSVMPGILPRFAIGLPATSLISRVISIGEAWDIKLPTPKEYAPA